MGIYSSSLELIEPLLGAAASADSIATAVVSATYAHLNASWAETGNGSPVLSNAREVAKLYARAYTDAQGSARRRRLQAVAARSAAELQPLFESVGKVGTALAQRLGVVVSVRLGRRMPASIPCPRQTTPHNPGPLLLPQVIAATNARIETVVQQAAAAHQQGSDYDAVKALVQIVSVSAVQQMELATAISDVSTQLANNPSFNITEKALSLESVRRPHVRRWAAHQPGAPVRAAELQQRQHPACPASSRELRPLPNPQTAAKPKHHPQSFDDAKLSALIDAKLASMPDIVQLITDSQSGLGTPTSDDATVLASTSDRVAVIVGTVVGFGAASGIAILGLIAIHRRRAALDAGAAAMPPQAGRYAGHTGGARPIGEGTSPRGAPPASYNFPHSFVDDPQMVETAEAYYRRHLRAQAALTPGASSNGGDSPSAGGN
jgi:hypothetical protein